MQFYYVYSKLEYLWRATITIKKAEHRRTDAFELWCGRRLLSLWDCKEIQPVHSEGDQPWVFFGRKKLKVKLQYFGHLTRTVDSLERLWCWERLRAGWEGDDRGWDGWMASPTQWTWVWVDSGSWWWTGKPGVHGAPNSRTQLRNWTELNWNPGYKIRGPILLFPQFRSSLKTFKIVRWKMFTEVRRI